MGPGRTWSSDIPLHAALGSAAARRVALEALVCATQPVRRMRVQQLACSTAFTRPAPKWRHSEGTRAAHSDGKSVRAREEGEGGREGGSDEGEGSGALLHSLSLAR